MELKQLLLTVFAASVAQTATHPVMEPVSSAEVCGRCHRAIHNSWKNSSHAQAMESQLFQDVLALAESDFGSKGRRVCLSCHSPLALQTGDLGLTRKVSWEGVTCDYCHAVRNIDLRGANPVAVLTLSVIKSGPLRETAPSPHGTIYSAVHTSSLICAPCHEYRNALGFPVLTTYSEWQNSHYAKEAKQCQSCHMYRVAGQVVDPRIQRSGVAKINLHQMPGSHSLEQLTSALKGQLFASHERDRLKVIVDLTNKTAGHYLPTGSPLRRVVLEVRADNSRGQSFREERIYARTVADGQGTPIMREHTGFLRAAKTIADTRLAPGEKRTEEFSFPIPPGSQAYVKATFWYYYSPMARIESQKRITFLTLTQLLR